MANETLTSSPTRARGAAAADETNLAYILAVSYSGSTLLAMLLGSQPDAATVGEMRAPALGDPEDYRCSCGDLIRKCDFWREVSNRMAQKGVPDFDITAAGLSIHETKNLYIRRLLNSLPRNPLFEVTRNAALGLAPGWRDHLRNVHLRNSALVEVLREITGARTIIDSSKIALHLKYLLGCADLRIKVIHLVRDGRAVTMSMLGHGLKLASRRETVAAAARSWRRNNEAAERVIAARPASQWQRVQYEELCRQPEPTLRGLCEFLGMKTQNLVMDFRAKKQHVLGNDMRLASGSDIRLDERWRTGLTQEDLATFEEVAGPLNRKYGYQ